MSGPSAPVAALPTPQSPTQAIGPWRWASPLPQGNTLNAVWGAGQADVYAVGDHGTVLHSGDHGKTWVALESGTSADLDSIAGVNEDDIYVGGVGVVLHTKDRGATFVPVSVDASEQVFDGDALDIITVGKDAIRRSTDNGATYKVVIAASAVPLPPLPDGGDPSSKPAFVGFVGVTSDLDFYAVASQGQGDCGAGSCQDAYALLHSSDGGKSWPVVDTLTVTYVNGCPEQAPSFHVRAVKKQILVLGGNTTDVSTDGGKTFAEGSLTGVPSAFGDLVAACVLREWGDAIGGYVAVGPGGAILHSSDGGATFARQVGVAPVPLAAVWASSPTDLYAAGGNTVLHSTDGGATFASVAVSGGEIIDDADLSLTALWGSGPTDVYAAGGAEKVCGAFANQSGLLFHSTDGGKTFATVIGNGNGALMDVWGTAASDVYAAGFADLHHSADGGKTWTDYTCDGDHSHDACGLRLFGAAADVWVAGAKNTFLHSTDHGATWKAAPKAPSAPPEPLADGATWSGGGPLRLQGGVFLSPPSGADQYRFGAGNSIDHSTDGGKTFTTEWTGSGNALVGLFVLGQDAWAVGDNGTILHRVPQ